MEEPCIVYGLRLKGDREVRYVGETHKRRQDRLIQHMTRVRTPRFGRPKHVYAEGTFGHWLGAHKGQVEIFDIAECDSKAKARVTEKVVIALCQRLNHRLFNSKHMLRPKKGDAA